jgi:hypothetical protein
VRFQIAAFSSWWFNKDLIQTETQQVNWIKWFRLYYKLSGKIFNFAIWEENWVMAESFLVNLNESNFKRKNLFSFIWMNFNLTPRFWAFIFFELFWNINDIFSGIKLFDFWTQFPSLLSSRELSARAKFEKWGFGLVRVRKKYGSSQIIAQMKYVRFERAKWKKPNTTRISSTTRKKPSQKSINARCTEKRVWGYAL